MFAKPYFFALTSFLVASQTVFAGVVLVQPDKRIAFFYQNPAAPKYVEIKICKAGTTPHDVERQQDCDASTGNRFVPKAVLDVPEETLLSPDLTSAFLERAESASPSPVSREAFDGFRAQPGGPVSSPQRPVASVTWQPLVTDGLGKPVSFTQYEAANLCASEGFRLPTAQELAVLDSAEQSRPWEETLYPGVASDDPRVVEEIESQKHEGFGFDSVLTSKTPSVATVAFYSNSTSSWCPGGGLCGVHLELYWSSTIDPKEPNAQDAYVLDYAHGSFTSANRSFKMGFARCVADAPWSCAPPPAPGDLPSCSDCTLNLRNAALGFVCRTSKGAIFERVARNGLGESWRGPDGIAWGAMMVRRIPRNGFVSIRRSFDGEQAKDVCHSVKGSRLPTIQEYARAESNGFREVLPFWDKVYWSSSPGRSDSRSRAYFDGSTGAADSDTFPNNMFHARCVSR